MIGILDTINARQLFRYNQIFNEFDRCWILLCKISDLLQTIIFHHQRNLKLPQASLFLCRELIQQNYEYKVRIQFKLKSKNDLNGHVVISYISD